MEAREPVLGLGTATFGREIDEEDSLRILDHAFASGIRIFDTAESYGGGNAREYRQRTLGVTDIRETTGIMHSAELILGKWIRDRGVRREVFVAGKALPALDLSASLSRSLDRLKLDFLDGYYLHSPPAGKTLPGLLAQLQQAKAAGLIRAIGLSNFSASLVEESCCLVPQISLCQSVYNLARPEAARDLIPLCERRGIGFWAYSPLGAGFLTGKYGTAGEVSVPGSRFDVMPGHRDVYFHEQCFAALHKLERASANAGVPQPLLALAWVLRQPAVSAVLVGATSTRHIENAIAAQLLSRDLNAWSSLSPSLL